MMNVIKKFINYNNMPKNPDNTFEIVLDKFYQGFSPAAHLNVLTELGNGGHASVMQNVDVLTPDYITQGPGLLTLNNPEVVDQLINFILDQPTAASKTYGIGTTKLFRITPTAVSKVVGPPAWPQTVTNMADGQSLILLKGNLYGFYNKTLGGDIFKMPISTEVVDPDWGSDSGAAGPTGYAALQKALHPSAKKEDLMTFGNGRYFGVYTEATDTLEPTKLDFGNDHEVADVLFHANQWWIAVNGGVSGANRNRGQIYLYDGGAISSILSDETAVGLQKIGFLYVVNGIVFVAYQDLSFSGGYKIGYVVGRQILPIAHFTGALPTFAQKTLYKNTILFVSGSLIWSVGAIIGELPYQISQHADGGHATVGAIAAPFGVPMVASTDGASAHKLAKFSGYDVACNWKSLVIPLVHGRMLGYIDEIIVLTGTLGANARCDLVIESDQASVSTTTAKQITGTGKRRHYFDKFGIAEIEDLRIFLDWTEGDVTNDCPIRKIVIRGHFVKK
ncbi:hypothetical protein KAU11_07160 [Candidatus Babeliales bacterium]|nr:hypothetical protein [Candidatus Babeliales bacterium]